MTHPSSCGSGLPGWSRGLAAVTDLRATREAWTARISARSDSAAWPLIELILRQPIINTAVVTSETGVNWSRTCPGAFSPTARPLTKTPVTCRETRSASMVRSQLLLTGP